MRHFDSKPDDMELKLDHMDSRFDRMESFFTTELSTINELLTVLVVICRVMFSLVLFNQLINVQLIDSTSFVFDVIFCFF